MPTFSMAIKGRNKQRSGFFDNWERDLHAGIGELIGTVLFLIFPFGAVQNVQFIFQLNGVGDSAAKIISNYYICVTFGLSLFVIASIFYRFTGSIFNPSVSLALLCAGVIRPLRFLMVCTAQMVGGIIAAAIVFGLTPGKLGTTVALSEGVSRTRGLFIEAFGTAALTLNVLMLAAEKNKFTPFAPLGFGICLMVVMLFAIQYTGGSINTARAFGPAVFNGFEDYHWIYWLGPTLGSLFATAIYALLKKIKYWEVNPNQDDTSGEHSPDMDV